MPSNGLLVITESGVILVDTAWNDEETNQILKYVSDQLNSAIIRCYITHYHIDRSGGLAILVNNGIPIYMTDQTNALLPSIYRNLPYAEIKIGESSLENFYFKIEYPGEGHSPDNIIIYFENLNLLYGGCLVKSKNAKSIGRTQETNVKSWKSILEKLRQQYKSASLVVPGHGDPGSVELLATTYKLLENEID